MLKLDYRLDDAGWAEAIITTEEGSVTISSSYLRDSLKELTDAVMHLLDRGESARAAFVNEPGEHHLVFERIKGEELQVMVLWYDDIFTTDLATYQKVLHGRTNVAQVRREVLHMLSRLLRDVGEKEYRRRWMRHPFPSEEFERLRAGYKGPLPLWPD